MFINSDQCLFKINIYLKISSKNLLQLLYVQWWWRDIKSDDFLSIMTNCIIIELNVNQMFNWKKTCLIRIKCNKNATKWRKKIINFKDLKLNYSSTFLKSFWCNFNSFSVKTNNIKKKKLSSIMIWSLISIILR